MTLSTTLCRADYTAAGSPGEPFPYGWRIFASTDLQVYRGGALQSQGLYSVTGVNSPTGGNVIFTPTLTAGEEVILLSAIPQTQLEDLTIASIIPAETIETMGDRLTRLIHQLQEVLSRVAVLPVTEHFGLAALSMPAPDPLKVFGWNANGNNWTLFASAILQVVPDSISGIAYTKTTATVSSSDEVPQLTAANFYPAGSLIIGVTGRVLTTFGNSNGLTGLDIGDSTLVDRWGAGIARTAPTITNAGQFRSYGWIPVPSARDVYITASAGLFDPAGSIKLTCHALTLTPDA